MHAVLGVQSPVEPPTDFFIEYIIDVFYKAHRSRPYTTGFAVTPMHLGIRQISDVVEVYPSMISREILDYCILAIDLAWMDKHGNNSGANGSD